MDTKPLERFATSARRELINAVDAQATAVLAVGSVARSERTEVVKKLETEIGRHGRQQVVDKVAYTWFNRIIALRFMDARGYTDAGVVSPTHGQTHGQPEILSDAKRGNLDTDVIMNTRTVDAIIGLLDGTRRSTDAEGEAYALLLTEYCRYWHQSMPFMFEREGDYTELLVPANLLADGAILARAREVLTEDVCADVEVIGWLYQFYISERKDEVFAGFKRNKKAGAEEIPAATQLFTPHWIVRYLVENSLGRLWMLNRPNSRLIDQMEYYIAPVDEETGFLKVSKPEELTVIDPACGSGHMLTYAFDLLYAIYEEEGYAPSDIPGLILTHNLHGTEIDPRAGSLAAFALAMKARGKQRSFFGKSVAPRIFVIEPISFGTEELGFLLTEDGERHVEEAFWNQFAEADTFGALIQPSSALVAELYSHLESLTEDDLFGSETIARASKLIEQAMTLSDKYSVVVANPPYMGTRNMGAKLQRFALNEYPDARADLMTMFMKRAAVFAREDGFWGVINLPSWMALASSEQLRHWLLEKQQVQSLVQMGRGVFGTDFGSVAFVIRNSQPETSSSATYRRLYKNQVDVRTIDVIEALFRDADYNSFEVRQSELATLPGAPLAFWLAPALRDAFTKGQPVGQFATPKQGLATADNDRFLRRWWEVSQSRTRFDCESRDVARESGAKWFPYNKGGEFRRWSGNREYVVNWAHDGREIRRFGTEAGGRARSRAQNTSFYFSPSVSWSGVTVGSPGFRSYPAGFIHDVTGMSIFGDVSKRETLLAVLNSTTVTALLQAVSPTFNIQIGDVAVIPVLDSVRNLENVEACVATSRRDWDDFEVSWDFAAPSLISAAHGPIAGRVSDWSTVWRELAIAQQVREIDNNRIVAEAYGVADEISVDVPLSRVTLARNAEYTYGAGRSPDEYATLQAAEVVRDLISHAVGCMFGRYSLDEPGLILADQGATLQDYLAKVPAPTFLPDSDNVIPFVDDGLFDDDIVERFRQFLRTAFGADHFEENLRFVENSLGVNTVRDYFITKAGKSKFYDDHVQRYKKRPIYWMFSSPKGSFNALIYMHRYTPSTVSTVLNEYLREYRAKLEVALADAEQAAAGGRSAKEQKEADRLRKVLAELRDYEHDVLYPLATQQIGIDLDDGVKANYPKFHSALKKITGLEAAE